MILAKYYQYISHDLFNVIYNLPKYLILNKNGKENMEKQKKQKKKKNCFDDNKH